MNPNTIIPPNSIINKDIYLFLYSLLKSIFINDPENRIEKNRKLDSILLKIKYLYKLELKRIYSRENFENIIKYIKTQNIIYTGEILENILLTLFNTIMKIPKSETINKYVFNNLQYIFLIKNKTKEKQIKEIDFIRNFIIYEKLYPEELKNKEIFFQPYVTIPTDLEYFLALIYKIKIESLKNNNKIKENKYNDISSYLYKYSINNKYDKEEKNFFENGIIKFEKNINNIINNYKNHKNSSISLISYFFFTLFVNYQTINCQLINYYENNKDINKYSNIDYDYDFKGSSMKGYYATLVSSPMRQDSRIKIISMEENNLGELGMGELGKTIVFNQNIKILNYNRNRLYSYYFYYLKEAIKIFNNNSIEEINLQNNHLKDDIDDYLCDILQKFKNLKILNLSNNKIGSGISKFLNKLKLLYRKKSSKLEKLKLNNCYLDSASIFELSECLKCKYCKLKYLSLNINNIKDYQAESLLNAIKKNNSLKEIYLGRNYLGNYSTEGICKIISRFHNSLETLYLNQNEIRNDYNLLKISYRTKIIYANEERQKVIIDLNENDILKNLDLSRNGIYYRNKSQLLILKNVLNNTYLSCLDYSLLIKDFEHQKICEKEKNIREYENEIKLLNENLNKIKIQRNKLF